MFGKFNSPVPSFHALKLKDLNALKNEKFIYLTTRGRKTGKSHVVELWFAVGKEKIYLSHEGGLTDWMKNIKKDGNVKLKIAAENFDGTAILASAGSEGREAGKKALYEKYYGPVSQQALDDWFELSTLVEITPSVL
jgi:deazaflavin-dependent oxidoreductase (nitroreductase family)